MSTPTPRPDTSLAGDDAMPVSRRRVTGPKGAFVGVNERAYPHHFSALASYHTDAKAIAGDHPLPPNRDVREFESFLSRQADRYEVQWAS